VRLQPLSPEGMQRRLEGGTDGDHAADKGRKTSRAEALRHPLVKPPPAAHVDDHGQAEWHRHPEIDYHEQEWKPIAQDDDPRIGMTALL
jgi:hypothetical protein